MIADDPEKPNHDEPSPQGDFDPNLADDGSGGNTPGNPPPPPPPGK